jgi:hypothetical protein
VRAQKMKVAEQFAHETAPAALLRLRRRHAARHSCCITSMRSSGQCKQQRQGSEGLLRPVERGVDFQGSS